MVEPVAVPRRSGPPFRSKRRPPRGNYCRAVPELMLYAAQRFAKGKAVARRPTSAAPRRRMPPTQLAMRVYGSTDDPELRSRALDVIDQLLASGVRDMQSYIDAYEDH